MASAVPDATLYALGSDGETSIRPSTMPMTGLPPNFFIVDHATRAGRNAKAVSVSTVVMRVKLASIWTPSSPAVR